MSPWPWRRRREPKEDPEQAAVLAEQLEAHLDAAGASGDPGTAESDATVSDLTVALELATALLRVSRDPEHRVLAATVLLDGDQVERAREVLEPLADAALPPDLAATRDECRAECWIAVGEPEKALGILEAIPASERDAAGRTHWLTGLCHDHLGRSERADACFRRAEEIDPDGYPFPIPISPDAAETLARRVIEELPPEIRALIDEVPVVIDDLPPLATIRETRGGIAHDTLGLYSGMSLVDRGAFDPSGPPPMIQVFRRNLERFARDREELEEEIRITLLHELGHHLGLDEDGVDRLGLG